MVKRIWYLCCAMVGLSAQCSLAAEPEARSPEIQSVEKSKTGLPAETAQATKQPLATGSVAERWIDQTGQYFSPTALGYQVFPLALFVEADRLLRLFREANQTELPRELICAQFSRHFAEKYFQRAIEHDDVVDDIILGTKIDGQSHLTGAIRLVLQPSEDQIQFDLIFTGVCRSQTKGVNDVVVLQNTAETQFQARKRLVWQAEQLTEFPAKAQAETHSTTQRIDSTLPGLRGWIVTQIAEQRVADSRTEADAISSQHAAARIQRSLDARVDHSLAWARLIAHHLPANDFLRRATRLQLSSTPEYLQVIVRRRDLSDTETQAPVSSLPEDCDLAIQIHRGITKNILRDPVALLIGSVVLGKIITTEQQAAADTSDGAVTPRPAWQLARSADNQWLLVQHRRSPDAEEDSLPVTIPVATSAAAATIPEVR